MSTGYLKSKFYMFLQQLFISDIVFNCSTLNTNKYLLLFVIY